MTRSTRNIILTAAVFGTMLAGVAEVQACHGRYGGGFYRPRAVHVRPRVHLRRWPQVAPAQPVIRVAPQPQTHALAQPVVNQLQIRPASQLPPQAPPASQPATTATPPSSNAQMSALQALAGLASPQSQSPRAPAPVAQTQPVQPAHVGAWTASLSNGARVQLNLQADGSFRWLATNASGTTSTFEGSYSLNDGAMTLVRSGDNQKLTGTFKRNGNDGFNFKLAGAQDVGLDFVRG